MTFKFGIGSVFKAWRHWRGIPKGHTTCNSWNNWVFEGRFSNICRYFSTYKPMKSGCVTFQNIFIFDICLCLTDIYRCRCGTFQIFLFWIYFISIMDIYRCRCGSFPFAHSQLRALALRQMLCSSLANSVKIHAIYTQFVWSKGYWWKAVKNCIAHKIFTTFKEFNLAWPGCPLWLLGHRKIEDSELWCSWGRRLRQTSSSFISLPSSSSSVEHKKDVTAMLCLCRGCLACCIGLHSPPVEASTDWPKKLFLYLYVRNNFVFVCSK